MNRIYHTWEQWECYPAGFYDNKPKNDLTADECMEIYRVLLSDPVQFSAALEKVMSDWPNSCEHYLSNEGMNRIAWLGQAALCVAKGIPSVFRGGFNLLTPSQQGTANEVALRILNQWLSGRGELEVTMDQAGIKAKANLY
jgi:hypothetical protein